MIQICICQDRRDTFLYNRCMNENSENHSRLKELRLERGLSQRELAAKVNIKQANISRWESGLVVPNVNDVWTLADFFDVSIDYLIGRKDY